MINIISFVALLALSVSLVSAGCDYNVYNVSQLTYIFNNDQSGWTTVPTLCFAPGTYTASGLYLTASQIWVGPQQGVDPTCGRLINPPCARYTSASKGNDTVEAIINPSSGGFIFTDISNVNITIDGFYVNSANHFFTSLSTGTVFSITFRNTFVWNTFIQVAYMTFDRCFVGFSNLYQTVTNGPVLNTVTNSFFSQASLSGSGSVTAIGNTFLLVSNDVASFYGPSHFENNAFYGITGILLNDYYGQTSFKNNTFWATSTVYFPNTISTPNFDSNCFVDTNSNNQVLTYEHPINTTNAVFRDNYFGDPSGPQVYYSSGSITVGNLFGPKIGVSNYVDFNFTYVSKHLHFAAPNVCPRPVFSLTVKPSNIKLGETVNITVSFELNPLIIAAGVAPSLFDGTTLQVYLNVGSRQTDYNYLYAFSGNSQTTLYPSTQSSFSFNYTFIANDLYGFTQGVLSPPNYYVVANLNQGGIYKNEVYAPITITPKVPLECYNMSLSINKNVTAGPLKYNFQQLGCSSTNWKIISVNTSNLFSYVNFQTLQIMMAPNMSGVRLAHYQVSFVNSFVALPLYLAHNVVTKITIINHNPVINSANFTWIYPRTQQTFPNWNLLTNCTDQDGDNVTVVQIQRNKARTNTSVVQLDDFTLYFVPEKVVVSVLPTGEIKFTAPSNSNPVTAGSPLALFWKQDISFQFQISDGDVIKQYAWGIANIVYV